jgi:hypothetical protein
LKPDWHVISINWFVPWICNDLDWDKFVTLQIIAWREKMFNWIPAIRHGGVLHYENFIHNQSSELRKMLQYLNSNVDERRLKCFLRHQFKAFKRNVSAAHNSRSVAYSYQTYLLIFNFKHTTILEMCTR